MFHLSTLYDIFLSKQITSAVIKQSFLVGTNSSIHNFVLQ